MDIINNFIDALAQSFGIFGFAAVIFAETGLFFGFFLPGDSLLISAGIFASNGTLNIWYLLPALIFASIAGDNTGFWIGRTYGDKFFKADAKILKKDYLDKAHEFFIKNGMLAIIFAKFIPAVRTFTPIVMGAAKIDPRKFLAYSIISGLIWAGGLTFLAYKISSYFDLKKYDNYIILGVIVLSLIPVIREYLKAKKASTSKTTV